MKRFLIIPIILAFQLKAFAQPDKLSMLKTKMEGIDSLIERIMLEWKVAGLSVAVVYKDQLLYAKGFGYRDVEQRLPVTVNTVFPIASCTKAFTSMLVGMAVDKKLLNINKPAHDYFPELEFYTPELTRMVTAKDMMTHRTGLPRHDWMTHGLNFLPTDSVIHRIRFLEPSKGIREEVQYNNLMYVSLGELTRKVTGKDWADQLNEFIFRPLEMSSSTPAYRDLTTAKEFTKGYSVRNDSFISRTPSTEGPNAAGSINSNVIDLSHWLMAWIDGGKYKGNQVLPASFVREASTPQMSTPSRPNPNVPAYPDAYFGDMGYGWITDSYRGHYHVQHSGDLPLFSSNTAFFPTDSIGIVVLVNKFNATVPELISSHIADRLLDLPYKDWTGLLQALQQRRATNGNSAPTPKDTATPVMNLPLIEYAGIYHHPGYGTIHITFAEGKLMATHNGQFFSFTPKGGNEFKANVPGGALTAILSTRKKDVTAFKRSKRRWILIFIVMMFLSPCLEVESLFLSAGAYGM
ncbi:MAG: serine hydrolase, partial [Sphingobacteriales bacterium]